MCIACAISFTMYVPIYDVISAFHYKIQDVLFDCRSLKLGENEILLVLHASSSQFAENLLCLGLRLVKFNLRVLEGNIVSQTKKLKKKCPKRRNFVTKFSKNHLKLLIFAYFVDNASKCIP